MATLPMDADSEAVLNTTLQLFRDRMIAEKAISSGDLETLEKAMRLYGQLCAKEQHRTQAT